MAANKQRTIGGQGSNQIKFPMTRDEAMRVLAPYLWDYEKRELQDYDTIYFFNI